MNREDRLIKYSLTSKSHANQGGFSRDVDAAMVRGSRQYTSQTQKNNGVVAAQLAHVTNLRNFEGSNIPNRSYSLF